MVDAAVIVGAAEERPEIENTSRGGSTLTDDTDVAVSAAGPLSPSAVISATPPGVLGRPP